MGLPSIPVFGTNQVLPSSSLSALGDAANYAVNPPAVLGTRTSLSIPTAAITPVTFDVEVFDNGNFLTVTSAIFTVPDRGLYWISGSATWGTISATGYRMLLIYQNAVEIAGQFAAGDASASIRQTVATPTLCAAGDTVELRAFHSLGVSMNLTSVRLGLSRHSGT